MQVCTIGLRALFYILLGWLHQLTSLFLKLFFSANTRLLHQQNSLSSVAVSPETIFSNAYLKCLTPNKPQIQTRIIEPFGGTGTTGKQGHYITDCSAILFVRKISQRLNTISMSQEQSLSRKKDGSGQREHFFILSGLDDLFYKIFRELAKACY